MIARGTRAWDEHIRRTAAQLRLVQGDCAREAPDRRHAALSEVVDRATATVEPPGRSAFLESLDEHFPVWDAGGATAHAAAEPVRSGADDRDLGDWTFLTARLVELLPTLGDDERRLMRTRLADAGLVPAADAAAAAPEQVTRSVATHLGLPADRPVDPARVSQLADLLVEAIVKLDHVARENIREMDPDAVDARGDRLRDTLGRYVSGDPQVTREACDESINAAKKSVLSLVFGIRSGLSSWSAELARRFHPDNIRETVKVGAFERAEVKCWEQYARLAATQLKDTVLRDEVTRSVAEKARRLRQT